jgi:hypothetical protein
VEKCDLIARVGVQYSRQTEVGSHYYDILANEVQHPRPIDVGTLNCNNQTIVHGVQYPRLTETSTLYCDVHGK